jgi:hypothetical protein
VRQGVDCVGAIAPRPNNRAAVCGRQERSFARGDAPGGLLYCFGSEELLGRTAETLIERRARANPAREALSAKFATPEDTSAYFRSLGRNSARNRVVISRDEAHARTETSALLGRIAEYVRRASDGDPGEAA